MVAAEGSQVVSKSKAPTGEVKVSDGSSSNVAKTAANSGKVTSGQKQSKAGTDKSSSNEKDLRTKELEEIQKRNVNDVTTEGPKTVENQAKLPLDVESHLELGATPVLEPSPKESKDSKLESHVTLNDGDGSSLPTVEPEKVEVKESLDAKPEALNGGDDPTSVTAPAEPQPSNAAEVPTSATVATAGEQEHNGNHQKDQNPELEKIEESISAPAAGQVKNKQMLIEPQPMLENANLASELGGENKNEPDMVQKGENGIDVPIGILGKNEIEPSIDSKPDPVEAANNLPAATAVVLADGGQTSPNEHSQPEHGAGQETLGAAANQTGKDGSQAKTQPELEHNVDDGPPSLPIDQQGVELANLEQGTEAAVPASVAIVGATTLVAGDDDASSEPVSNPLVMDPMFESSEQENAPQIVQSSGRLKQSGPRTAQESQREMSDYQTQTSIINPAKARVAEPATVEDAAQGVVVEVQAEPSNVNDITQDRNQAEDAAQSAAVEVGPGNSSVDNTTPDGIQLGAAGQSAPADAEPGSSTAAQDAYQSEGATQNAKEEADPESSNADNRAQDALQAEDAKWEAESNTSNLAQASYQTEDAYQSTIAGPEDSIQSNLAQDLNPVESSVAGNYGGEGNGAAPFENMAHNMRPEDQYQQQGPYMDEAERHNGMHKNEDLQAAARAEYAHHNAYSAGEGMGSYTVGSSGGYQDGTQSEYQLRNTENSSRSTGFAVGDEVEIPLGIGRARQQYYEGDEYGEEGGEDMEEVMDANAYMVHQLQPMHMRHMPFLPSVPEECEADLESTASRPATANAAGAEGTTAAAESSQQSPQNAATGNSNRAQDHVDQALMAEMEVERQKQEQLLALIEELKAERAQHMERLGQLEQLQEEREIHLEQLKMLDELQAERERHNEQLKLLAELQEEKERAGGQLDMQNEMDAERQRHAQQLRMEVKAREELEDMILRIEKHFKAEQGARRKAEELLEQSVKAEMEAKTVLEDVLRQRKEEMRLLEAERDTIRRERHALESMRQEFEQELTAARAEMAKAQEALASSEDRVRGAEAVERARLEAEYQGKVSNLTQELERTREELQMRTMVMHEEMERWRQQATMTAMAVFEAKNEVLERKKELDQTKEKMDRLLEKLYVGRERGMELSNAISSAQWHSGVANQKMLGQMGYPGGQGLQSPVGFPMLPSLAWPAQQHNLGVMPGNKMLPQMSILDAGMNGLGPSLLSQMPLKLPPIRPLNSPDLAASEVAAPAPRTKANQRRAISTERAGGMRPTGVEGGGRGQAGGNIPAGNMGSYAYGADDRKDMVRERNKGNKPRGKPDRLEEGKRDEARLAAMAKMWN